MFESNSYLNWITLLILHSNEQLCEVSDFIARTRNLHF